MTERKPNQKAYQKLQIERYSRINKSIQVLGSAIHVHAVWLVIIPSLITACFGAVILAFQDVDLAKIQSSGVKSKFLSPNENLAEIREFEKKWFGDTWATLGNSRHCGQLLFRSKNEINMLSDDAIKEVLKLHNVVLNTTAKDPLSGFLLTYGDVCAKVSTEENKGNDLTNQTGFCATDPFMQLLTCSESESSKIKFAIDTKTSAISGVLSPTSSLEHILDFEEASNLSSHCRKWEGKNVSLDLSVGLLDKNHPKMLSAMALRTFYILQDDNEQDRIRARSWLKEFENRMAITKNMILTQVAYTTESASLTWMENIGLKVYHVLALCTLHLIVIFVYTATLDTMRFAVYVAACGSVTLVMTLICTYSIQMLTFGIPTFNFVLCGIFVTAVHELFQVSYIKVYLRNERAGICDEPDCDESFIQTYQDAFYSHCWLLFLFSFTFGPMAIPVGLSSFRNMCVTSCLGFLMAFFYQITCFPGCIRIYQIKISTSLPRCCTSSKNCHRNIDHRQQIRLMENRIIEETANVHQTCKKQPKRFVERVKRKLNTWIDLYLSIMAAEYIRPTAVLILLTYISFGYVGCLHFTEQINESQLLSENSAAYKFLEYSQEYFQPSSSKFVLMGSFIGNSWDQDVRKELLRIHNRILQVDAVYEKLSADWFTSYIKFAMKDHRERAEAKSIEICEQARAEAEGEYLYEEECEAEQIPLDMDESLDWKTYWKSFIQTSAFKACQNDIRNKTRIEGQQNLENAEAPHIGFRWIYYLRQYPLPGERVEFLLTVDELLKQHNTTILTSLYIDAPEFDWWRSIQAKKFTMPIVYLLCFNLATVLIALILLKTALVVLWSVVVASSVTFGVTGMISLCGIGLDSFTIICIVFCLPYSTRIVSDLLFIFASGVNGGRAAWTKIALRKSYPHALCHIFLLLASVLVIAYQPCYMFRAPLVTLVFLTLSVTGHFFLFLPTLLTVFPPSKKVNHGLANSKTADSSLETESTVDICAIADARPHLHARRYFYDSQRVAFRSEEEGNKIEQHITCL